jgi:hypothetical protein
MPTLRETQERLFRLITAPESVERTLAACGLSPAHVEELVVGDARRSAVGRLDLYANMYFFRLLEALRHEHPALAAALGDDQFHNLVTGYLQAYPSTDPSLRHVGDHLAEFLGGWLAELARLERARLDCFDAVEVELCCEQDVRALSPDELAALPLRWVPAHALISCCFAVDEAWAQAEAGQPVTAPAEVPRTLLVWRKGVEVFHRHLDDDEAELIRSASHFGQMCEELAATRPAEEAAARGFLLLGRWLTDGLLQRLR